jgi:hypothetical protein
VRSFERSRIWRSCSANAHPARRRHFLRHSGAELQTRQHVEGKPPFASRAHQKSSIVAHEGEADSKRFDSPLSVPNHYRLHAILKKALVHAAVAPEPCAQCMTNLRHAMPGICRARQWTPRQPQLSIDGATRRQEVDCESNSRSGSFPPFSA